MEAEQSQTAGQLLSGCTGDVKSAVCTHRNVYFFRRGQQQHVCSLLIGPRVAQANSSLSEAAKNSGKNLTHALKKNQF